MKIPRKYLVAAGLVISSVFLYLTLRNVEWERVLQVLKETNYWYLVPAAVVFTLDFLMRAYRWKYLLLPVKRCRYWNLASSVFIGFFANTVFPMRAGEVIRTCYIGEQEGISKMSALASIAAERVLDGLTIVTVLALTFYLFPIDPVIKNVLIFGIGFFFLALITTYALIFSRKTALNLTGKALSILPDKVNRKINEMLGSFITGLSGMKSRQLLPSVLISAVTWSLNALVLYLTAMGMGIEITYPGAAFMMAVTALGISIPSSPGHIGVLEYFGVLALMIVGVARSDAVGFILLTRAFQTVLILSLGGFFLGREHISIFQLGKKAEAA